jgi:hypothetical protein
MVSVRSFPIHRDASLGLDHPHRSYRHLLVAIVSPDPSGLNPACCLENAQPSVSDYQNFGPPNRAKKIASEG